MEGRENQDEGYGETGTRGEMVTLKIALDEQVNFEITGHPSDNSAMLVLELAPARAMELWLRLEYMLEAEGLIWSE